MVTVNESETGRTQTARPNVSNVRPNEAAILRDHEALIRGEAHRFQALGDVEDRMQEGRLAAVLAIRTYHENHGATMTTWIWRCVRNRFIRLQRDARRAIRGRGIAFIEGDRATGDDGACLRDLHVSTPASVESAVADRGALAAAVSKLKPREYLVLRLRFEDREPSAADESKDNGAVECSRTLEEVGKILGCTRERVRQIEAGALGKLRTRLGGVAA